MKKSGAKAYLVNTGWNGTGKRISIRDTRGIIDAILSGAINEAPTKTIPYFNFEVPTELPGVDPAILDPRDTYADASEWETKALDLAARFIKNFAKYEGNAAGKALVSAENIWRNKIVSCPKVQTDGTGNYFTAHSKIMQKFQHHRA